MKFSQILQDFKDRTGWTDQRIADALTAALGRPPEQAVSRAVVNQWRNDKQPPSWEFILPLCKILGWSWQDLVAVILGVPNKGMPERNSEARLLAKMRTMNDGQVNQVIDVAEAMFPSKAAKTEKT